MLSSSWGEFLPRVAMLEAFYKQLKTELDIGLYAATEVYVPVFHSLVCDAYVDESCSVLFFVMDSLLCMCDSLVSMRCREARERVANMLFNFSKYYTQFIPRYALSPRSLGSPLVLFFVLSRSFSFIPSLSR